MVKFEKYKKKGSYKGIKENKVFYSFKMWKISIYSPNINKSIEKRIKRVLDSNFITFRIGAKISDEKGNSEYISSVTYENNSKDVINATDDLLENISKIASKESYNGKFEGNIFIDTLYITMKK